MCGITGFWQFNNRATRHELLHITELMAHEIATRGPDASGAFCDESQGLALGHHRLSIIDLSEAGAQPMTSQSGRMVLIYNGEVYNGPELRAELIQFGCRFRGYSDTEVILEACEQWGVEATCKRLIGMFAFALWDKIEKRLFLVRDRLGIKPLYWGFNQGILFFGSQVKSFTQHPKWQAKLNQAALGSYFRFNYIPAPLSIFQEIHKLKPGCILSVNTQGGVTETAFWDFQKVVHSGIQSRVRCRDNEYIEELDILLRDAVKRRMVADVPLGAFLSGGIDSSTVVALMQAQSDKPIQSFSIGFFETGFNEAQYAAQVAAHLGTEHHELYLKPFDAQAIIPEIPNWCDEPFADVSQIPTFLVSKMARERVIVSLSGDGGDELFGGYSRYFVGHELWHKMRLWPAWLRRLGAYGITRIAPKYWDYVGKTLPKRVRPSHIGDKAYKLAEILKTTHPEHFYRMLVSHWEAPSDLLLGGQEAHVSPWDTLSDKTLDSFVETMQMVDTLTYLPDDILTKVDRASMAVSLEARVPLLDHRVVEYAWKLPLDLKIRQGQGKWILRQVLNRYLPQSLIERPKMGFGVPIDAWLRGPLREWAEHLLSYNRLKSEGVLNPEPIQKRWQEHLSGSRNWQYSLWGVLMFQAWKERWNF